MCKDSKQAMFLSTPSPFHGRRSLHQSGVLLFALIAFSSLSPFVWAGIFHRAPALSAHADSAIQAIAPRGRECSRYFETSGKSRIATERRDADACLGAVYRGKRKSAYGYLWRYEDEEPAV